MKYKVGDKVKAVTDNPCYGWGLISKGDSGVVFSVDTDRERYLIAFERQNGWYAKDGELELVESAPIKAYDLMKLAYENPQEYEGRRYKVVEGYASRLNDDIEDFSIDDTGRFVKDSFYVAISSNCKVEEIPPEPKPVPFMEAINSGREIKPLEGDWVYDNSKNWLRRMSNSDGEMSDHRKYINSMWLIKP